MLFLSQLKAFKDFGNLVFSFYWYFYTVTKMKHDISDSTHIRHITLWFPALKNSWIIIIIITIIINKILLLTEYQNRLSVVQISWPWIFLSLLIHESLSLFAWQDLLYISLLFCKDSCVDWNNLIYTGDYFVITFQVYLAAWFILNSFMDR